MAEAQAVCQGSLATSFSSVPALAKFVPAATRSGVVFHSWLDTNRTPAAGHLVLENTNSYPVAVRFDAELRGAAGSVPGGSRCVWLRPHEFGGAVLEYTAETLSSVRIGEAEVTRIEAPPARLAERPEPARAAPSPRPRAAETIAPSSRQESTRPPTRRDTAASRDRPPPTPARRREAAASPPRETVPPEQAARRDTTARVTAPRREIAPPARTTRRDTTARASAPRREAVAPAPSRQKTPAAPRRGAREPASTRRAAAPPEARTAAAPRPEDTPLQKPAAGDSPRASATRVPVQPADTPLTGAPVIAPRPAPERSHVVPGAPAPAGSRAAPGIAAGAARSVEPEEAAPPLAKTGTTVFSVAFGAVLVPAGVVLLMAIAGGAWLLAVGSFRRAWPWRRRE